MTVIPLHKSNIVLPRVGNPIIGLIAAFNPVMALVSTVVSLLENGASWVVIVNDGSTDPGSLDVFDTIAKMAYTTVLDLPENVGKSSALRAGYLVLPPDPRIIIMQTDDDTSAGRLKHPFNLIRRGKADIVDIRIETFDGNNLIGLVQQLDYWLINATIKRFQNWIRSRLWVSGASLMYTYEAGKVLLLEESVTRTEDTEGYFRSIGAGLKLLYCSKREAAFKTMVPETMAGVRKQWQRWALGNGQVIKLHGLGGGRKWIALVNLCTWIEMTLSPVSQFFIGRWLSFLPWTPHVPGVDDASQFFLGGLLTAIIWMMVFGTAVGAVGALTLRRWKLTFVGIFIPLLSLWWAFHALEGIVIAQKYPRAESLNWVPPKRMDVALGAEVVRAIGAGGAV